MAVRGESVVLRPATSGDVAEVAEIWRSGWADAHLGTLPESLEVLRTPESFDLRAAERIDGVVVAAVNGKVAGFVLVVEDEIEHIYVAREQRGGGISAVLLAEAQSIVAANGHDRAWLAIVAGNDRLRAHYERVGWQDEGPMEYPACGAGEPIPVRCHRYAKKLLRG
ncbi:GNAT family N-acetyltransferase [Streptomyces sp. NPDC051940]|uniref:GNAT family N-acetyltransferase n=1 Tax=Streptomyces sp. NPDC051940 TaxID=3155675 RepID=UPI0034288EB0